MNSAEEYYIEGKKYYDNQKYYKAIDCFNNSINLNLKSAEIYNYLGASYSNLKLYRDAMRCYLKALELKPPNIASIFTNMGLIYNEIKNYPKAIEILSIAVKISPDDSTAWYTIGKSYYKLRKYHNAIDSFYKCINLNHNQANSYVYIGSSYFNLKKPLEAIESYKKTISIAHGNINAMQNLGTTYLYIKNNKLAIEWLLKVIDLNPNSTISLRGLGQAYSDIKDYKRAIHFCNKSISVNPNDYSAWSILGYTYSNIKNNEEAMRCLYKSIEIAPEVSTNWMNLGLFYYRNLKDIQKAMCCFNRCIYLIKNEYSITDSSIPLLELLFTNPGTPYFTLQLFDQVNNPDSYIKYGKLYISAIINSQIINNYLKVLKYKSLDVKYETEFNYTNALINYFMGDVSTSFLIYDKKLDNEYSKISLSGQYYYVNSAFQFEEPAKNLLHFAVKQADEYLLDSKLPTRQELYYAGQIFILINDYEKAFKCFELSNNYLPSKYKQIQFLKEFGKEEEKEMRIKEIIKHESKFKEKGYLNGFTKQIIDNETSDFYQQFLTYAVHYEISMAVSEVRAYIEDNYIHKPNSYNDEYNLPAFWKAFYFNPEDEETINKVVLIIP